MGYAMTTADLARQCTTVIWNHFIDHQDRFRSITRRAAKRFMHREWSALQADTANRLNLYPDAVDQAQNRLCAMLTNRVRDVHVWAGGQSRPLPTRSVVAMTGNWPKHFSTRSRAVFSARWGSTDTLNLSMMSRYGPRPHHWSLRHTL